MAWMGNVPHRLTYVNIGLELGMVFRGSRGIFGVGGVAFWSGSPGSDLWELPSPYSSPPPLHSRICHKREGEQLLRAPAAMLLHCDGFSAVVGFPLNNPPLTKLLLLVFFVTVSREVIHILDTLYHKNLISRLLCDEWACRAFSKGCWMKGGVPGRWDRRISTSPDYSGEAQL